MSEETPLSELDFRPSAKVMMMGQPDWILVPHLQSLASSICPIRFAGEEQRGPGGGGECGE